MTNFTPQNDAQEKMNQFLWRDYTEGRSSYGRITAEEYQGYRALLEKEDGLFLVDIGTGEYDTYLSYADIEQLVENKGVSDERMVKVHPSQWSSENNEISLYELQKKYITREVEDAEGNALKTFSERRLELLRGPLREEGHATTKPEMEEERGAEVEAMERSEGGIVPVAGPFASEKEQILALIEADEMNGILTHEEAEAYREKAEFGELILVDVGTGNFDTYLSKEDAEELANDPENEGRTYRVYNRTLLDDEDRAKGEIKVSELEDLFVKKETVGALLSPAIEENAPVREAPEEALQKKQEQKTEAKRDEEMPQPGLPPSLSARAATREPREPHELHAQGTPGAQPEPGSGDISVQTPDVQMSIEASERSRLPGTLSPGLETAPRVVTTTTTVTETTEASPSDLPQRFHPAGMPGRKPKRKKTEAKPKGQPQNQSQGEESSLRGGPKRYQPPAAPTQKPGSPGKKWAAAMVGGTGGVFGGVAGFELLRGTSDAPELALWIGHFMDPLMRWFT
jgi:hypothetical protein